jgi:hypothetical protein
VRAVFDRSRIERGPGEKLLLQEKIRQGDRVFEKGSRQTISLVSNGLVHFDSGLRLRADDGRVRQGDCLTDYKAQGIKGAQVRGIEDNGSAMAMANKEAFHVKGTRHVQNLILHVENKGLYVEAIQRSNEKFSALQLERVPVAPALIPPLTVDRGRLLMKVRSWGQEFLARISARKRAEQIRHQLTRLESLRPRVVQTVSEKITPEVKEAVWEKPAEKVAPTEKVMPSVEEMAQKLRQRRNESLRQRPTPPAEHQKQSPFHVQPAPRHRQGRGISM